jgi:Flp pilus assembly protein TadG
VLVVRAADPIVELARREDGGVLVIVALWLPLLVVLGSFVIDVGNWFEHRRHLQLQADAAALAAAGDASGCRKNAVAANALIEDRARRYGGVATTDAFNAQVGGTPRENVHLLLNSQTWFDQADTVDPTVNTAGPCQAAMIDVKLTETNLPWFFRTARVVPFINAHSRVSFLRVGQNRRASVPIGVPDANPKRGQVQLVDESTGSVLASAPLARAGTDAGQAIWNNAATPIERRIDKESIGVRVVLSGSDSTTCGDPLVECYQQPSTLHGLGFIRGYSTSGTVGTTDPPRARDVRLLPGTCPAAYFVAAAATCQIAVDAAVDFGATIDPVGTLGARVTANIVGQKSSFALSYDATAKRWRSAAAVPVAAAAGEAPIELQWERTKGQVSLDGALRTCSTANNNPCKRSFGVVQRAVSAREDVSGPIQGLYVTEVDAAGVPVQLNANSFPMCASAADSCTPRLVVEVRIPNLQAAQSEDASPVTMRIAGSGSRTQALDCDPDLPNLKQELAGGCGAQYVRNTGQLCPSNLNGVAEPWNCVAVSTGAAVSHMDGLTDRILDGAKTCTSPNRWASYWTADGVVKPDPSDPRLVQVMLTPFGAFSGSGGGTVPVVDFAYFYITGWRAEKANPCTGQGDDPAESGYIVGHFVEYVDTLNTGQAADEPCDLSAAGNCVAVLTH